MSFDFDYEYMYYKLGIGKTYYSDFNDDAGYGNNNLDHFSTPTNPCGSVDTNSMVNNISGRSNSIYLFPNPTSSSLTISSTNNFSQITITNLLGQTLFTHDYNAAQVQVDVADLPSGIYFVKINGTDVRKFVKE